MAIAISNVTPEDTFEMSGDIEPTSLADQYRPMLTYPTDEDALKSGADLPFDEE
ncbi:MAG TPA: hypothetical protein V6C86_26015 [Oculatellaceae cyanobacterium]|jgi:hypothetical protein